MAFTSATSLSATLAHAISYLTRPLIVQYSATTINKLQLVLEANLTALYAPTWVAKEPLRGSGRRCLTLSPECLPPRVIYSACLSAGVQWFDWIALLGGEEFDFFVDPGCVSVRRGRNGSQLITVWADELPSPIAPTLPTKVQSRTIAQQLLESEYDEEEQIFAMISQQTTWVAPSLDRLAIPSSMIRSSSPFSTESSISASSSHSRSSSRSSNSSSGFSYSSNSSSDTTISSASPSSAKPSRRERVRQARVFVDTSKTEITPYDGGKTTVLTGGVMLGGNPTASQGSRTKKVSTNNAASCQQWRAARV